VSVASISTAAIYAIYVPLSALTPIPNIIPFDNSPKTNLLLVFAYLCYVFSLVLPCATV